MGEYNGISTERYEERIQKKIVEISKVLDLYGAESSAFRSLHTQMTEELFGYLMSRKPAYYVNFYLEIVKAANDAISGYSEGQGDFLHYFNVIVHRIIRKQEEEERGCSVRCGVTISPLVIKRAGIVNKYCEENGISAPSSEDFNIISDILMIKME